jgi:hypothetical protein
MANTLEIIVKAKDEASKNLSSIGSAVEKMSSQVKVAGAAMTAIGIAGLKLASDARKMNADLGYTGQIIGASAEDMRDLALAITDVTFGLQSVTSTFEILARAGVRDTEIMKQNALAFDALADATKSSAEIVADTLIPAYKMFGEELPTTAEEMDKWTYLVTTTNVELSELGSLMGYVATYGRNLALTSEDIVVIMKALAEQGLSASDAARLFRTGINQAEGSLEDFYDILGINKDEIQKYTDEMNNATGITKDLQEQQESQYTVLGKLKQKWQEMTLYLAPVLEVLEPIFSVMTAMGPAILAAVYVLPRLSDAFTILKAKMAAVTIQAKLMWGAITLGISLAIAGIVELIMHWETIMEFFGGEGYRNMKKFEQATIDLDEATKNLDTSTSKLSKTLLSELSDAASKIHNAYQSVIDFLSSGKYENVEFLTDEQIERIREVKPDLADAIVATQNLAKEQGKIADSLETQLEAVQARLRLEEIDKELLTATGTERETLLAEQARLLEKVYITEWKAIVREHEDEIVGALKDLQTEWDMYFNGIKEGWETLWTGNLDYVETEIMPKLQEAISKGILSEGALKPFRDLIAEHTELLQEYNEALQTYENLRPRYTRESPVTSTATPEQVMPAFDIDLFKKLLGLQYGGIVTRPTAALIGEAGPEAVIPLSQMNRGDIVVNVGYLMGDDASMRKLVRYIQQMMGQESRRTQFGQLQAGYYYGRSAP